MKTPLAFARLLVPALPLLLAGCGQGPGPTVHTASDPYPVTGRIVLSSNRAGNFDLYIMTLASGGETFKALAKNAATEKMPAWSPDGSQVAFVSSRSGRDQLYVVDADGTDLRRLTFGTLADQRPTWSPDGTKLAFQRGQGTQWALWRVNLDGSGLSRLTPAAGDTRRPSWSPDGSRLACQRWIAKDANYDICTVSAADGGSLKRLTNDPAPDGDPAYSRDGQWLAFTSKRGNTGGAASVWLMKADGSGEVRVTSGYNDLFPCWSPDGHHIGFQRDTGGTFQVDSITPDGHSTRLITSGSEYVQPSWAE